MKKRIFTNPVFKDRATLLVTSEDSNGACTKIEVDVAPGGGNWLHAHDDYSEKFTVLAGSLTVKLRNQTLELTTGMSATVPPKALHCFNNTSDKTATFLVELSPGQPDFEKSIAIAYGLAEDNLVTSKGSPKKLSHLAILIVLSRSSPVGILKIIMPLFQWIAKNASKERDALIQKYC